MITIQVNGKPVQVGDEFKTLTPEQQNATVDEIAAAMGQQPKPAERTPAYDELLSAASQASQMKTPQPQQPNMLDQLMGSTAATINGLVNSNPLTQLSQKVTDNMLGMVMGRDEQAELEKRRQELAGQYPAADIAGNLVGGVGTFGGLAKLAPEAVGMTGGLLKQTVNSGLSTLGLGTASSLINGQTGTEAITDNLGGAGLAAAIPGVGKAIKAGTKAVYNSVAPTIKGMLDPAKQASLVAGKAFEADKGLPGVMKQADEGVAALNDQSLVNADRGGETVRALTRAAVNVNPEAKAVLKNVAQERFHGQADRAVNFIKRITGGATDDLALQQGIKDLAKSVNKPAYRAAYDSPQAAAIWTPEIRQLMSAPEVQTAIHAAENAAKTDAALNGGKVVVNPFIFRDGEVVGLRKMQDGSTALPSLQFWDVVQRQLRTAREALGPKELTQASRYDQLRGKLLGVLDTAVPQFQVARQGAAKFFDAEDALDAGRKFANSPKTLPEQTAAHAKFSEADKKAFAVGYASSVIDKLKVPRYGQNVINSTFDSPAQREMAALALGEHRAKELEAFVRVEQIMDHLRQTVEGNSSTASQLYAMGIIGGTSALAGLGTGNLQNGLNVAMVLGAGRVGMRYLGKTVDQKVMQKVAEMLASGDKKALDHAIANAALSKAHMQALEAIMKGFSVTARGATQGLAVGAN